MNRRAIALLTTSHLCNDLGQGALPAILPFLIAQHHFSYAAAAGLVLSANMSSSLLQPLLGLFADRASAPWLVPTGLLLAGTGLAFTGIAPNYPSIAIAAALSGVGLAAFHPEAARLVSYIARDRRATGMSIFAVGGNAGFALGPLLATLCLSWFGLKGSILLAIPAVVVALVLVSQLSQLAFVPEQATHEAGTATATDAWGPFAWLTATIVCRSIVFFGFNTFLPLYWIGVLHQSKQDGGTALTILLVAGAIGTLIGGQLADRYGRNAVVLTGLGILPGLLLAFVTCTNVSGSTALLIPIGLALFAPFSVMVVMGQEYLPNRVGVASGVTLGLAGSVGGLAAPLLGQIADRHGLQVALATLVLVSLLAVGLALPLLRGRGKLQSLAE